MYDFNPGSLSRCPASRVNAVIAMVYWMNQRKESSFFSELPPPVHRNNLRFYLRAFPEVPLSCMIQPVILVARTVTVLLINPALSRTAGYSIFMRTLQRSGELNPGKIERTGATGICPIAPVLVLQTSIIPQKLPRAQPEARSSHPK